MLIIVLHATEALQRGVPIAVRSLRNIDLNFLQRALGRVFVFVKYIYVKICFPRTRQVAVVQLPRPHPVALKAAPTTAGPEPMTFFTQDGRQEAAMSDAESAADDEDEAELAEEDPQTVRATSALSCLRLSACLSAL